MANWSNDTFYFGRAQQTDPHTKQRWYTNATQTILRKLQYAEPTEGGPYCMMMCIEEFGPAVRVDSCGKYGAMPDFSDDCWKYLDSGIVVHQGDEAYGGCFRTIHINGVKVFDEQVPYDDVFATREDDEEPIWDGYKKFAGRDEDEAAFFEFLWLKDDEARQKRLEATSFEYQTWKLRMKAARKGGAS